MGILDLFSLKGKNALVTGSGQITAAFSFAVPMIQRPGIASNSAVA